MNNKKRSGKLSRFWKLLGPGLVTGASDDDPSGIATYSQAGAQYGLSTLWTALITFPLMAAIQEMCARIGMVTSQGLTGTLKTHYPKSVLYLMVLFSFPAIVLNIGADIAGMGAVGNLLFPDIHQIYFSVVFTILLLIVIVLLPYKKIAAILKYLCIVLLVYLIVPFLYKQDFLALLKGTFIPIIKFDKQYISILVGILGTTISPYLFFWQATMEVEAIKQHKKLIMLNKTMLKDMKRDVDFGMLFSNLVMFFIILTTGTVLFSDGIHQIDTVEQATMEVEATKQRKKPIMLNKSMLTDMKKDVDFGMLFSNLVMFFIILTTGTVLFSDGIHQIDTVEQAAQALKPLAGESAYLLFAIGVIGTGLLAIPVLSGSLAYIVTEAFGWEEGLDKKFQEAKSFYLVIAVSLIIGLSLEYIGISPIQALIYSAILYGLTAPVLIAIILHISNNKKVMGEYINGRLSNFIGFLTL